MRHLCILTLITLGVLVLANCTGEKSCGKVYGSENPNGDSELTLVMRDMETYYKSVKAQIEAGDQPNSIKHFEEILSAVSTEPEKAKSPAYQAMAQSFIQLSQTWTDTTSSVAKFNSLVDNCMSCHQTMCPGPMVRIKKLYTEI